MAFFDATVFSGFLAFDLNTYSHSKNIFIFGGHFMTLEVIRWSNTGFVAATVFSEFLAFV